ncbi:MAG: hypothetical protein A4S12_04420 [Proteobacteria bacterium SG_bin5]|nr:MAG: hypothetical protein A4S12_04420 [Proteobacteria bacterium SG_bin5]
MLDQVNAARCADARPFHRVQFPDRLRRAARKQRPQDDATPFETKRHGPNHGNADPAIVEPKVKRFEVARTRRKSCRQVSIGVDC